MRHAIWPIAIALLAPLSAQAQIISTVAGFGPPPPYFVCRDNVPATEACLIEPAGVVMDATGNLFITDSRSTRKVELTGTITTVAPVGGYGLSIDAAGDVFIADSFHDRVLRVDVSGTVTTVAGNGTYGFCGDGGAATRACLAFPLAVAVAATGDLFIADYGNSRIRKVDMTGRITTVAGGADGRFCGDGGPATSACVSRPAGVAVDSEGNLFIADRSRIRRVDMTGTITTVAGNGVEAHCGDGGPATAACLRRPAGLAIDAAGTLFIGDAYNHRIRMVDAAGTITTVAGRNAAGFCDGPATRSCLNYPWGVALDADGALFIADWGNDRIRKLELVPPIVRLPAAPVSGCLEIAGKVELVSPAPQGGRVVALSSDNVHVVVPAHVTVPAGTRTGRFTIATSAVAGAEKATIEATAFDRTGPAATLTLKPMTLQSLTLSPGAAVGGTSVTGTVTLECAAGPGDITVTLTSSNPAVATPTAPTVTIPSGSASATFSVTTAPVTVAKTPSIKATANGVTRSKGLTVSPGS